MTFIRRMEKMWYIFTVDFSLAVKKWNYVISRKMDGTLLLWARCLYLLQYTRHAPLSLTVGCSLPLCHPNWLTWTLWSCCLRLLSADITGLHLLVWLYFGAADRAREERNQACFVSFLSSLSLRSITSKEVLGFICDSLSLPSVLWSLGTSPGGCWCLAGSWTRRSSDALGSRVKSWKFVASRRNPPIRNFQQYAGVLNFWDAGLVLPWLIQGHQLVGLLFCLYATVALYFMFLFPLFQQLPIS